MHIIILDTLIDYMNIMALTSCRAILSTLNMIEYG